ncbi:Uncharacterised protein [Mycobacteroides abscessus subsp. abscessus]|nr:Uncharacterised protein [Mycobacteroides abscessus subsp. abscessus]
MHTGATDLTGGVQTGHLGAASHVGDHPTAAVMGTGHHRNRLAHRVDTSGQTRGRDRREPARDVGDAAGVEVDVIVAGGREAGVDGGGHDVARSQVTHRVHTVGHGVTTTVTQDGPFSAQRFGDQRAPATGRAGVQHGRVELDEFDVTDRQSGPQREGDAVARRSVRVGRRGVQLPQSTGRQNDRRRRQHTGPLGAQDQQPADCSVVVQHLQRNMIGPDVERPGRGGQGTLDLGARGVAAGMDDAPPAVPALTGQGPVPRPDFIESRTGTDQFTHGGIAVGDDRGDRVDIAQAGAGRDGVGDVRLHRVIGVGDHDRDTALGIRGRRLAGLADDHDPATSQLRGARRSQAGHPGADDDDVGPLAPVATSAASSRPTAHVGAHAIPRRRAARSRSCAARSTELRLRHLRRRELRRHHRAGSAAARPA